MSKNKYPLVPATLRRKLKKSCDRNEIRSDGVEIVLAWANSVLVGQELLNLVSLDEVYISEIREGVPIFKKEMNLTAKKKARPPANKSGLKPLSQEWLDQFRKAFLITSTGRDAEGNWYNETGKLAQAVWIGENAGKPHNEIDRLRLLLDKLNKL